ncbi:hypothetical protein FOL47_007288, partial [Perkinsus chesapeaki]
LSGRVYSQFTDDCVYEREPAERLEIILHEGIQQFIVRSEKNFLRIDWSNGGKVIGVFAYYNQLDLKGMDNVNRYNPLVGLPDNVEEDIKTLDPKNMDNCRRLFTLLARYPPAGYRSGIDWVWSFVGTIAKAQGLRK